MAGEGGAIRMVCQSCKDQYGKENAGTCKECYDEASETEEELKREIDDLKSKLAFLRLLPPDPIPYASSSSAGDREIVLLEASSPSSPRLAAHRAVLASRSPVFKAMLCSEMEEARSGVVRIPDASYTVLYSFVQYLYTAEAPLDEALALDLMALAEMYQVNHLKSFCERFLASKVSDDNALTLYPLASRYGAKKLLEATLSSLLDNMAALSETEHYRSLVQSDPRLIVEIYEAYLARQVNTASDEDSPPSPGIYAKDTRPHIHLNNQRLLRESAAQQR